MEGSIDPSKGITDVVDADLVDDSNPYKVEPCFFIAPENNICVELDLLLIFRILMWRH